MSLIKYLLNESTIDSYIKYTYNEIDLDHWYGFNSKRDAIEYMEDFMFPMMKDLYKKGSFIIYRVITVENINDIDYENLGHHYTLEKDLLFDRGFYEKIGISLNDNYIFVAFELQVEFDDVAWEETIYNRLQIPREDEINLKDGVKPKIKDKFVIKKEDIK